MTAKQMSEAQALHKELQAAYPALKWSAHLNYHTKLIYFTATAEHGGFSFDMIRTYSGKVYLAVTHNDTQKSENGATTSEGFGTDLVKEDLTRLSWPQYMAFVRRYAARAANTVTATV